MAERERDTYFRWLSKPEPILELLWSHFVPEREEISRGQAHVRWRAAPESAAGLKRAGATDPLAGAVSTRRSGELSTIRAEARSLVREGVVRGETGAWYNSAWTPVRRASSAGPTSITCQSPGEAHAQHHDPVVRGTDPLRKRREMRIRAPTVKMPAITTGGRNTLAALV
jgi:imidazolonepropionase-like amidohydrolase